MTCSLLAAFTPLLLCLPGTPNLDQKAWLEGLPANSIAHLNLTSEFHQRELGIEGFDLGLTGEAEDLWSDAKARLESGETNARLFHQASIALYRLKQFEYFGKVMGPCLHFYQQECEAAPDDFDLRMGFALALELACRAVQEDDRRGEFMEGVRESFEEAARIEPDSWLPWGSLSGFLIQSLRWTESEEQRAELVEEALETARSAIEADPDAPGGYWYQLLAQFQLIGIQAADPDEAMDTAIAALEELEEACERFSDDEPIKVAARTLSLSIQLKDLLSRPWRGEREAEREDLLEGARFLARGWSLFEEYDELAQDLSTMACLSLIVGQGETQEAYAFAATANMEEERRLALTVAALSFLNDSDGALENARLLVEVAESDYSWSVAAKVFSNAGEQAQALEALEMLPDDLEGYGLLHAIILLRSGQAEEALAILEALLEEDDEDGEVLHTLGVARAMEGDQVGAIEALEAAVEELDEPEEAQAVLDELAG